MLGFIERGIEFNRLANSFGQVYISVNELTKEFNKNSNSMDSFREIHRLEILILLCVVNKGIAQRIDKNAWGFEWKISVPKIETRGRITIGFAWTQTVSKLMLLVNLLNMSFEAEQIREEGILYNEIINLVPQRMKNW